MLLFLPGLTVGELKEMCRDNSLRVGATRRSCTAGWATGWLCKSICTTASLVLVPMSTMKTAKWSRRSALPPTRQHRDPPRDPANKRPQVERDIFVLLAAQQRELGDLALHSGSHVRITPCRTASGTSTSVASIPIVFPVCNHILVTSAQSSGVSKSPCQELWQSSPMCSGKSARITLHARA